MFTKNLFILALCALPALSAPSPLIEVRKAEEPVAGRYIVTLKDGVNREAHVGALSTTHEWDIINGFAGNFSEAEVEELRSNPDVASIEEEGLFRPQGIVTQTNAPWGLGRISSRTKLSNQDKNALSFRYKYDSTAGSGVTVYVIDSGILTSHSGFGGRASWGATFGGYPNRDGHGHGTHCAGSAVSGPYGVAKNAKVVAVKVMSDSGAAAGADVISGADWVIKNHRSGPAVVSFSLLSPVSSAIDNAISKLVKAGITTAVAAGNSNVNANTVSPARALDVITVGSSDITDSKASTSNFGSVIDIFAPGDNVISTWKDGKSHTMSGTSMATPHVAGFAAYLLGLDSSLTPASVWNTMKSKALNNVLRGIPSGTVNRLLYNGL